MCFLIFIVDDTNAYTVYVKNDKFATEEKLECNKFSHKGERIIKTVSVQCKQSLEGKYIQIVPSLTGPLRVYEIGDFGRIIKLNLLTPYNDNRSDKLIVF